MFTFFFSPVAFSLSRFLLLFFFPPLSLAYELPAWFNPHLPVLDYGVCLGERGKNDLITPLLRW